MVLKKSEKKKKCWISLAGQKGMSLFEVLIAIGIVAVVGGYVMKKVFENAEKADVKQAQVQINDLSANVKYYKRENKTYPSSDQGLGALVESGIMEEVPTDPWGSEYNYESPGSHSGNKFEIWSNGPDEESGTEDDIVSWKKDEEE